MLRLQDNMRGAEYAETKESLFVYHGCFLERSRMEIQTIDDTCQELLATLQGPTLQNLTASPALLRRIIVSIESLEGIADYLAETERRLYPDQAPLPGRTRRNKARKVKEEAVVIEEEQKHARILDFVEKWIVKYRQAPTLRMIRSYNKARYLTDIEEVVADMVAQGKLKAVADRTTMRYVIPVKPGDASVSPAVASADPAIPVPLIHLQLGDKRVGVWWVTGCYTKDGTSAYFLNEDPHLAYLYGSKEYHNIDRWVVKTDDYTHYRMATEPLEALQEIGSI